MTQSKGSFTRGPLTVDERGIIRHTNKNGFSEPVKIASAWREGAWEGDPEAIANATLYAAAPALLEVAREALRIAEGDVEDRRGVIEANDDYEPDDAVLAELIIRRDRIAAAIQSATGEG